MAYQYLSVLGCFCVLAAAAWANDTTMSVVDRPDSALGNAHYVGNRLPLKPSVLIKLPVGSIEPRGWLRNNLRLQADGFHGHLTEISPFLKKEGNAWLSASGEGQRGWEEVPYWLKGYSNCAYVLGDDHMIAETKSWIEATLKSQKADGWFGPDKDRTGVATNVKGRNAHRDRAILESVLIMNDPAESHGSCML